MHRDFRDWPGNRRIEKSATDRHRRDEKGKMKNEKGGKGRRLPAREGIKNFELETVSFFV